MQPHCEYTSFWSVQPFPLLSLTPLPPIPHFSIPFKMHPYVLYLHRRCVLQYYWLFSFPFPTP
jgi:hypothetical protein